MPETYQPKKGASLKDQLLGVKSFFRTRQREEDIRRAEKQRESQLRRQRVGKAKIKQ